jgi:NADH-quinone oxidoreductase subunit J
MPDGVESFFFVLFAGASVAASVATVTRRDPIYAVLSLVVALCATAGLFVLLEMYLIAVLQVLVYAGAVIVLFLFVLMLIRRRDLIRPRFPGFAARVLAPGIALLIGVQLVTAVVMAFRGAVDGPVAGGPASAGENAEQIGRTLFTTYVLPFEVASLLLLVAVLGAMALTRGEEP